MTRREAQAAAVAGSKDPSLGDTCLRSQGGGEDVKGCDVTKKGDAKRSHFVVIMGHLQVTVKEFQQLTLLITT